MSLFQENLLLDPVATILAPVPAIPSWRSPEGTVNVIEFNPTVPPPLTVTASSKAESL